MWSTEQLRLLSIYYLLNPPSPLHRKKNIKYMRALDPHDNYATEYTKRLTPTSPTAPSSLLEPSTIVPYRWNSIYAATLAELARKRRLHNDWQKAQREGGRREGEEMVPPGVVRSLYEKEDVAVVGYASNLQEAIERVDSVLGPLLNSAVLRSSKPLWEDKKTGLVALKLTWTAHPTSDISGVESIRRSLSTIIEEKKTFVPYDVGSASFLSRLALEYFNELRTLDAEQRQPNVGIHTFNYFVHFRQNIAWFRFFNQHLRTSEQLTEIRSILDTSEKRILLPWYVYHSDLEIQDSMFRIVALFTPSS
jgi:hypothetical protein